MLENIGILCLSINWTNMKLGHATQSLMQPNKYGISRYRKHNAWVRNMTKVVNIVGKTKILKRRWAGHEPKRMDEKSKYVINMVPERIQKEVDAIRKLCGMR